MTQLFLQATELNLKSRTIIEAFNDLGYLCRPPFNLLASTAGGLSAAGLEGFRGKPGGSATMSPPGIAGFGDGGGFVPGVLSHPEAWLDCEDPVSGEALIIANIRAELTLLQVSDSPKNIMNHDLYFFCRKGRIMMRIYLIRSRPP